MSRGGSDYTPARLDLLGDNIFGSDPDNTHVFTGSVIISGSLTVIGSGSIAPGPHAPTHIHGGSDEIDADQLDIDFLPTNYVPDTSPAIVSTTAHLTAHLQGIDNELTAAFAPLGQDLSGNLLNPFVVGLQGTPVSAASASSGQVLTYNSSSGEWEPSTLADQTPFGTHHKFYESASVVSTTNVDFIQAARFPTTAVPAGVYHINWSYVWSLDSTRHDFVSRVKLSSSTGETILLAPNHRQEPSDNGGTGNGGTDQRFIVKNFATASLTSGSHYVDIEIRTTNKCREATIHNSRVEIWRIS